MEGHLSFLKDQVCLTPLIGTKTAWRLRAILKQSATLKKKPQGNPDRDPSLQAFLP